MNFQTAAPAISRGGSGLPSRLCVYGVPGIGKTSIGAHAPGVVFLMTRQETGLLTLIDNGLCPDVDHFDEAQTWHDLRRQVQHLLQKDLPYRTLCLDTITGAQRMCFDHVTEARFNGSAEAFASYGRGVEVALPEWESFLGDLEAVRRKRKMMVLLLGHAKVKPFNDPDQPEGYDRHVPDMHEKAWALVHRAVDAVLFTKFETFVRKDKNALKAKSVSSGRRLFMTEHTAASDAKNRLGLPEQVVMMEGPAGGWKALQAAVREARQAARQQQAAQQQPAQQQQQQPAQQTQETTNQDTDQIERAS